MLIRNAMIFTENHKFAPKDVRILNERIVNIADWGEIAAEDEEIVDAQGLCVIPGLVDIHFHGAVGFDFCQATNEELEKIAYYEAQNGVLAICPTTMSYNEKY